MTKQVTSRHTPVDTKEVNGEIKTVYLPASQLQDRFKVNAAKVSSVLDKRDNALKVLATIEAELVALFDAPMRKAGKLDGMYLVPSLRFGRDALSFFRAHGVRTDAAKSNGKANALSVLD